MLAWKRGIAILTAGNVKVSPDPRVHLSNGYTLQIKDAREQDAGDYICQIATIDPREITHHVEILGSFRSRRESTLSSLVLFSRNDRSSFTLVAAMVSRTTSYSSFIPSPSLV